MVGFLFERITNGLQKQKKSNGTEAATKAQEDQRKEDQESVDYA
jgi:hypothetical protein